jgi:hypothetical protein
MSSKTPPKPPSKAPPKTPTPSKPFRDKALGGNRASTPTSTKPPPRKK